MGDQPRATREPTKGATKGDHGRPCPGATRVTAPCDLNPFFSPQHKNPRQHSSVWGENRGYLEIPENHDIRKNRTFEKIVGTRKFRKIMIFRKTGHLKNSPEHVNSDIRSRINPDIQDHINSNTNSYIKPNPY